MKKIDKQSAEYINFTNDVRLHREQQWGSIFQQLTIPITTPDVHSVLEFGPGRGFLGAALKHFCLDYKSVDVKDAGANPDYLGDIISFESKKKFDLVCAFQVLEHNPPETFVPHLRQMAKNSKKYVYVSLPFYGRWFSLNLSVNLPKIRRNFVKTLTFGRLDANRPIEKYRQSKTPYKHHWFEIGDKGFKKRDLYNHARDAGLKITKIQHSNLFVKHWT